jgi:hypothetical protein
VHTHTLRKHTSRMRRARQCVLHEADLPAHAEIWKKGFDTNTSNEHFYLPRSRGCSGGTQRGRGDGVLRSSRGVQKISRKRTLDLLLHGAPIADSGHRSTTTGGTCPRPAGLGNDNFIFVTALPSAAPICVSVWGMHSMLSIIRVVAPCASSGLACSACFRSLDS